MPVKGHSVSSLLRKAAVTLYFVLLLLPAAGFWQGGGRQQAVPGAGRRLGLASNTFLLAALAGLGCMAVGLAAAAAERLAQADPDTYGAARDLLRQRAQRAKRRRDEKHAHEKNLRRGKGKHAKRNNGPGGTRS